MILQIMGLLDVFVGLSLIVKALGFYFKTFVLASSGYLILKGLLFIKDPMSIVELFIGVIFLTSIFVAWPKTLLLVAALIILQKGFFSLVS